MGKTVEAGDALVKAAGLLSSALKENQASLEFSLEDCSIVYIPLMPYQHRSMWYEESLYLFLHSTDEIAYDMLRCTNNLHRKVHLFQRPKDLLSFVESEVEYNLRLDMGSLQTLPSAAYQIIMPKCYHLESSELIRAMKLLAFA